jgi:hypothetical protein
MATFPTLKTNAVAQYPATRISTFRNEVVRFVDGTEQRYRNSAGSSRYWMIKLDQLDAAEMAAVEAFFLEVMGRYGMFTFTDPWDGISYSCTLSDDKVALRASGEYQGTVELVIQESRG